MRIPTGLPYIHEFVDSLSGALEVPVELTDMQLARLARADPDLLGARSPFRAVSPRRLGIVPGEQLNLTVPVSTAANHALGMPGFTVIPLTVVTASRPVALLWLTDINSDLSPGKIEYARRTAESTLRALAAEAVRDDPNEADAKLIDSNLSEVTAYLHAQVAGGSFTPDDRFLAIGIWARPVNRHYGTVEEAARQLHSALRRLAGLYPDARSLRSWSSTRGILLVAPFASEALPRTAERLAAFATHLMLRQQVGHEQANWLVSVSEPRFSLDTAAEAVWEAQQGLALGQRLGWSNRRIDWAEVAHLRGISTLPAQHLRQHFIPPALLGFLRDPDLADLRETLQSYLLHAGNVQQVAAEAYVHRATVYHRLRRIERMLQVDLNSGSDRLELHLGLLAWAVQQRTAPVQGGNSVMRGGERSDSAL